MSLINRDVTRDLNTIQDFIRYAWSLGNEANLFYGHGTDNGLDDMTSLILGALHLPLDCDPSWFSAALTMEEKNNLYQLLELRITQRIPVPYLIHEARFYGFLFFYVKRGIISHPASLRLCLKQSFFL